MKKIMVVCACLILVGCGNVSRITANLTGHSEVCVNGVSYLQFPSGVTVKYNRDGTIAKC